MLLLYLSLGKEKSFFLRYLEIVLELQNRIKKQKHICPEKSQARSSWRFTLYVTWILESNYPGILRISTSLPSWG